MFVLSSRSPKVLLPVHKSSWVTPSQSQPKDQFGNENTTAFKIVAKLNDGHTKWTGWFRDREDFDEFLWAIANDTLKDDKYLWSLCTPNWHPDIGENITYQFATVVFLTSTPGTNATYTKPVDWNDISNSIECIGGGGAGAYASTPTSSATDGTGGGGGGYSKISNFVFTGSTATYRIGTGAPGNNGGTAQAGGDTWFNSSTSPGAGSDNTKAGAAGGAGGRSGGTIPGSSGGLAANGWGQVKYNGGSSGSTTGSATTTNNRVTGGGGAAGPNGAGLNGVNISATSGFSAGGDGDAGFGGAGATTNGGNGGAGSEFGVGFGSGGGGAGGRNINGGGGDGGTYGAGSGAQGGFTNESSGNGSQGLIVVTYTPPKALGFNMPMLGM